MNKQFNESWEKTSKSIFRLELLPLYNVPGDWECYQKFIRGEDYIDDEFKGWFRKLKETNIKGVKTERVRVYSSPVNDYIKYEIDVWKPSNDSSDNIFFLDESKYKEITKLLEINPEDFWLFDDTILITFHYNSKGNFIGEEKIEDQEMVKKCVELKYQLLSNSIPYQEFIKTI